MSIQIAVDPPSPGSVFVDSFGHDAIFAIPPDVRNGDFSEWSCRSEFECGRACLSSDENHVGAWFSCFDDAQPLAKFLGAIASPCKRVGLRWGESLSPKGTCGQQREE